MRILAYFNEKLYLKHTCNVCYKQMLAFGTKNPVRKDQRAKFENCNSFRAKLESRGQSKSVNEGINFEVTT